MSIYNLRQSVDEWRGKQAKTFVVSVTVILACLLFFYVGVLSVLFEYKGRSNYRHFGDYLAIWSCAKLITIFPAVDIYNLALLHSRQIALGMFGSGDYPFPYPPFFLLLMWPFGLLSFENSYFLWIGSTFAFYILIIYTTCSRLPICLLCAIIAPACTMNIIAGQTGFFSAALMIGGIRLAGSRPWLAGVLIGLLAYKPQLGILVPFALAATGQWRALLAASATVIGLSLVATAVFGWAVWPAWVSMLGPYADEFERTVRNFNFMPIIISNLILLGTGPTVARGGQLFATIVVTFLVARCFRRNPSKLAAAALFAGTFLATPHAFVYDFPMFVGAIVLFIDNRMKSGAVFSLFEVCAIILALTFPIYVELSKFTIAISALPTALVFVAILHRAWVEDEKVS